MSSEGRLEIPTPDGESQSNRKKTFVTFYFEGEAVSGALGEPVAMSLWAAGHRTLGWNEETGRPRSLFCGIGHCFECRMEIDGKRDQRSCLYPVREGLDVRRQSKPGALAIVDGMTRL